MCTYRLTNNLIIFKIIPVHLYIVLDLTHVFVQSAEEAYKVMSFGRNNLRIASNNLNKSSSRSHCIFTLKLMRVENIENPKTAVISRFNIFYEY